MDKTTSNIFSEITVTSVAQALAVGSAVGAITSVVFNMMRFQRWGLSFTDIATTSDIVMSGITVGLALVKIALVFTIGVVTSEIIASAISWLLKKFKCNDESARKISAILTIAGLIGLSLAFALLERPFVFNILLISLPAAVVLGLISGGFVNLLLFSRHDHFRVKDRYLRFIPALWILVAAVVGVKLQVEQPNENPLRWVGPSNFCLGAPIVVWVGSSSVVSRCSTSSRAFTYIVMERSAGVLGKRRAITRFSRDRRAASYRPIMSRTGEDWRVVPAIPFPIFIDKSSVVIANGQAQFIAVYFPSRDTFSRAKWPGTKFHISDQTVQCLFPYADRLISLIAYSRSDRRIRLDETGEDQRYNDSISSLRYQLSQFVCERAADGQKIPKDLEAEINKIKKYSVIDPARELADDADRENVESK